MPFDALNLKVITDELKQKLVGGKINKINQPEKDEITLNVFCGQNHKLLVSASGSLPRIHLTEASKPNPITAPSFCMVLHNATLFPYTTLFRSKRHHNRRLPTAV